MDAWFAEWVRRHHQDIDTLEDPSILPLPERLVQTTQRALTNRSALATLLATEASTHAAGLGLSEVIIPGKVLKDLGLDHIDHWPYLNGTTLLLWYDRSKDRIARLGLVWGEEAVESKRREVEKAAAEFLAKTQQSIKDLEWERKCERDCLTALRWSLGGLIGILLSWVVVVSVLQR